MTDPQKKKHTMKGISNVRSTWTKTGKGWRILKFEDMAGDKYWMDGKPFDPSKMGGGGN
jgi:hypothetical protein